MDAIAGMTRLTHGSGRLRYYGEAVLTIEFGGRRFGFPLTKA
jgi:hypothetical protein